MSLIRIYANLLKMEVERLRRLSTHDFREQIGALCESDLSNLLTWVSDVGFQSKLLCSTNSFLIYDTLLLEDPHTQAKVLNILENRQRRLVVQKISRSEQVQTLQHLQLWQQLEESNWPMRILPTLVMTGKLPDHYPPTMGTCIVCRDSYNVWDSVIAANCQIHSFCEDCGNDNEGACPMCMEVDFRRSHGLG
jgi:hypothetical protein